MADNTELDAMAGGDTVRTEESAGGVKSQVFILNRNGDPDSENLGATGSKTMSDEAPTDASATEILAANTSRKSAVIYNNSSGIVYLGTSGVAATTGIPLAAGQSFTDTVSTDAWYARCASGVTGDLRIIEVA